MPKHLTSAVKPLRTFLSFKDFNLLKSLAPSARSFFDFMTAYYFPHSVKYRRKIWPVSTEKKLAESDFGLT